MKIKNITNQNNRKKGSTFVFVLFFVVIFLALTSFAVDGTITFTNRLKLQNITEQAALAGASMFNCINSTNTDPYIIGKVEDSAEQTFYYLQQDGLKSATLTVNATSGTVSVTSEYLSPPFFLAFLGVTGIKLEAKAMAKSEPLTVTANYTGINWLTKSAAYLSDILSKDVNLNDTAILAPIGGFDSKSYDSLSSSPIFSRISAGEATSNKTGLNLGPGGFITIKLPVPIVNKTGDDLLIEEVGDALEGYMVFAGIDKDPANPYVNSASTGGGVAWVNITSSGTSKYPSLGDNAHQTANTQLLTNIQDKFYGSGYFDIGKCNLSMVKYIRIVDDNQETAFVKNNSNGVYYKVMIYGEASTGTPGADIGLIQVLNHVKLIR